MGVPADLPSILEDTAKVAAGSRLPCANQRVPSSASESSQRHQPLAGQGSPVCRRLPIEAVCPRISGMTAPAWVSGTGDAVRARLRLSTSFHAVGVLVS